jgi:hypothetical protein
MQFREQGESIAVPVGKGLYLYLGQTLRVSAESGGYRLRTLAYSYRISDGPHRTDHWLIRWEYTARDLNAQEPALHPRHHCHVNTEVLFCGKLRDLVGMHIATGWITIEEVIRFLIQEFGANSKDDNWDSLLIDSEAMFRKWTARDV